MPNARSFAAAAAIASAATALLLVDSRNPPELLLFIGRFHTSIVHFPIGLILLAGALELSAALHRPSRVARHAVPFVLILASVSAGAAVAAGYLLSLEGAYDEALLSTHRSLGIAVSIGALAATALRARVRKYGDSLPYSRARPQRIRARKHRRRGLALVYNATLLATAATVILAGHLGGTLTRGPGYLTQHMPRPVKDLLGVGSAHATRTAIADIDAAYLYEDLMMPVFRARCISCHGESRTEGGLRLDTPEALMEGGDGGAVIVAGDADESELLRRVTLPPSHEDAMPPEGSRPLDVGETELIRWWIANGASTEQRVADVEEIPTAVATLFNRIAPPRDEPRMGVYALDADPADPEAVAALRAAGLGVRPVARDVALLQVTAVNLESVLGDKELQLLLPLAEQITWLDLAHTAVDNAGLAVVAGMRNLTRLNLAGTPVGDEAMQHLVNLENLRYLNLYGTRVGDEGLERLHVLDALSVLYLWQTQVSERGIELLHRSQPELEVIRGIQ